MPPQSDSPFPLRLKQARTILGLSLRDLSEKVGGAVSHVALAKYEAGEMKPSGDVLARLCAALGRTPDFMYRPVRVSLEKVSFRKRKKFSEKSTATLMETVRHRLEDYLEAEELAAEQTKPIPKLHLPPSFDPKNLDPVRSLAQDLRSSWGLGDEPITSIVELLENHGFRVIEVEVAEDGFDGCLVEAHDSIVIRISPNLSIARKRHTVAHELAHAVLQQSMEKFGLSESEEESVMSTFASEFLLPSAALKRYFGASRTSVLQQELVAVKLRFGVSIAAIVYTMKALGIISESAHRRFYTQVVPRWKRSGIGEPGEEILPNHFREKPSRFEQLVLRGLAEGAISLSRSAGLLGRPLEELRRESQPIVE